MPQKPRNQAHRLSFSRTSSRSSKARSSGVADLVAPQSLPSPNEELWVIAKKPQADQQSPKDDQQPGTGSLMAKLADKPTEMVSVPLKHTDVVANVASIDPVMGGVDR